MALALFSNRSTPPIQERHPFDVIALCLLRKVSPTFAVPLVGQADEESLLEWINIRHSQVANLADSQSRFLTRSCGKAGERIAAFA